MKKLILAPLIATRIFLSLSILLSALFIAKGTSASLLLAVLAALTLADVLVNDVLPRRFSLFVLQRNRERSYTFLGASCIWAMFPLVLGQSLAMGFVALLLQATAACAFAVADTLRRYVFTEIENRPNEEN